MQVNANKAIKLIFALAGLCSLSGCSSGNGNATVPPIERTVNSCLIEDNTEYYGQIRYFHGMLLRLHVCPEANVWEVERLMPPSNETIFSALKLDPATRDNSVIFLNLTFTGSIAEDGKLIIHSAQDVEIVEKSLFD